MTRDYFQEKFGTGVHLLDGATGSNLMKAGMPRGVCSELWIMEHPEPLVALQQAYAKAGSEIIYAPTFGANRVSLSHHGAEGKTEQLNKKLVDLSRQAVGKAAWIAGDMTTTGQPVDPDSAEESEKLVDVYKQQAEALGEGGVDLFVVETMMGVTETVCAVEAIRTVCDLPIFVSMSVQADGKCYFDGSVFEAAEIMPELGADAIGVNCSSGPDQLESVIHTLAQSCHLPVIAKPNAGLPKISESGEAIYPMSAEEFARAMLKLKAQGASLLGGCCGTEPSFIQALANEIKRI